jgi:hypothetical protein
MWPDLQMALTQTHFFSADASKEETEETEEEEGTRRNTVLEETS